MLLIIDDIKEIFNGLISGRISREEADRWAYERMQAFDSDSLEFEPITNEDLLWSAIQYLYGIDTKVSPDEYMHSIEEIKQAFEKRWNK
jgi:hypothetical protein